MMTRIQRASLRFAGETRGEGHLRASFVILLVIGAIGCIHDPTIGPLFERPADAKPGFAQVYLYRVDPHHSFSTVEIQLDKGDTLQILDEEYIAVELEEGVHEIAFRLRRRLGWTGWTWRTQRIQARSGGVAYYEIAVAVTESSASTFRDDEIAGRPSGTARESVSIEMKDASEAVDRIRMTHLHVP